MDGVQLCGACFARFRFEELPIDRSWTPFALVRTLAIYLFRPRTARALYSPTGRARTTLALLAASALSVWLAALALSQAGTSSIWGGEVAPAPLQFAADLGSWVRRFYPHLLVVSAIMLGVDRLLLWGTTDGGRLARTWALTLTPLWTGWVAVALLWLAVAHFREGPVIVGAYALVVTAALPVWIAFAPVTWMCWRFWLLPSASSAPRRARFVALASPLAATAAFILAQL